MFGDLIPIQFPLEVENFGVRVLLPPLLFENPTTTQYGLQPQLTHTGPVKWQTALGLLALFWNCIAASWCLMSLVIQTGLLACPPVLRLYSGKMIHLTSSIGLIAFGIYIFPRKSDSNSQSLTEIFLNALVQLSINPDLFCWPTSLSTSLVPLLTTHPHFD